MADKEVSLENKNTDGLSLYFIKQGIVPKVSFKSIQSLMDLRHEGDYQDFVQVAEEEAIGAVEGAKNIIDVLSKVLERDKE